MSEEMQISGVGSPACVEGLLVDGLIQANVAQVIALAQSSTISNEVAGRIIRILLEERAHRFEGDLQKFPRSFEARLHARLGDAAAWLHADRSLAERAGVAFLIGIRNRILELAKVHLRFAETAIALADVHQQTLIEVPVGHANGAVTSLGHSLLTYVYPAFRDLDRLLHCYRSFNTSPCGAGRTATGARLPFDHELVRGFLGFEECRPHAGDAVWQGDGPIEIMAAMVALLVNLNRLSDDLRSFADANKVSHVGWIRSLTSELLAKVPAMASLGKDHDGNAEGFVMAAVELCAALDGVIRAVGALIVLVEECAHSAPLREEPALACAAQSDLVELITTRGGADYAAAERMVKEIDRLIARREIELHALTPEAVDVIAIQVAGRPLGLSAEDIQSAVEPREIIAARRGPGGVSPQRMIEMITECRARLVRDNLWVTVAGQRLAKAEASLLTEARKTAGL